MPSAPDWSALYALGGQRGGALRVADADRFGISRRAFTRRANREGWPQPYRGVRFLPGQEPGVRGHAWAALLAVGQPAWLAGHTAAAFLGGTAFAHRPTQLLVPASRRPKERPRLEVIRSRDIVRSDIMQHDGTPITAPARTVRDVLPRAPYSNVRGFAVHLLRTGSLTLTSLEAQSRRMGRGCQGAPSMARLLDELRMSVSDSAFELANRHYLTDVGFDLYPGPFPFRCDDGIIVHLDIVVLGAPVAIECDVEATHSAGRSFRLDRLRWNEVSPHWEVVWSEPQSFFDDPAGLADRVRRAVERSRDRPRHAPANCACPTCMRTRQVLAHRRAR